jgi:DNA-binding transcriptional ArsR family regulator
MPTNVIEAGQARTYGSPWSTAGSAITEGLGQVLGYYQEYQRQKRFELQQQQEQKLKAQEMAEQLDFPRLMVELSQGVRIAAMQDAEEVIFVPSYWTSPLVMYDRLVEQQWVVLFGARPAEVSLVPGEVVPDAMLQAMKALSDPTRLLILRYLSDQPQTPSQLARKLRLRAPTVTHHLSALRLAGLVYISLDEGDEKRYTVREAAIEDTFDALHRFLAVKGEG